MGHLEYLSLDKTKTSGPAQPNADAAVQLRGGLEEMQVVDWRRCRPPVR